MGKRDEIARGGLVMFKCEARLGGERLIFAVNVAHQIAFAIVGHAVAQDQIVHAPADIDRVDLHESVVIKRGGDIGSGLIEKQGPLHKPAGCFRGNLERWGHSQIQLDSFQ